MAEPQMIIEERESLLLSPKGNNPHKKKAHFIKPILGLDDITPERPLISLSFRPIFQKVTFNGWRQPTQPWISWVDRLCSSYHYIWKSAGIYEAILSSRYKIIRNEDLFFGLAERWCSETSTFVFPWGEATVTLEDVMILGGYSVLGDSVSWSVGDKQFDDIEKKLVNAHVEISRGKSQKANQSLWMKYFMNGESEIEHEAFLSLWLSRFVLPTYPFDVIAKRFFKIAIYLARGVKIALGPVVLASIYRDLSLLKSVMDSGDLVKDIDKGGDFDDLFMVTLWAPLQLVQVWAWERFPEFRPVPRAIEYGEPRLARWHNVSENDIGNVRPMLQSSGDTFKWRPYCKRVDNLPFPAFYRDSEEKVFVGSDLGEDTLALARFLRVCQLVGMDSVEAYNPHRVAMQFGFDQDIPVHVNSWLKDADVPRREAMKFAWLSYTNPIIDQFLFVPSKNYEPKVTMRYLKWHRDGIFTRRAAFKGVVRRRRSSKRRRRLPEIKKEIVFAGNHADVPSGFEPRTVDVPPRFLPKKVGNGLDVPPGFLPKKVGNGLDVPPGGFLPKKVGNGLDVPPGFSPKKVGNDLHVPPGFPPKPNCAFRLDIARKDGNGPFVKVKEEFCIDSNEDVKPTLNCSYQNLNTPEIGSNVKGISAIRSGEASVIMKSNLCVKGKTKPTAVQAIKENSKHGYTSKSVMELEDRIRYLERAVVTHGIAEESKHGHTHESMEVDLADRIGRLERAVVTLKEAKPYRVFSHT